MTARRDEHLVRWRKLVISPPSHGGDCGFESRTDCVAGNRPAPVNVTGCVGVVGYSGDTPHTQVDHT